MPPPRKTVEHARKNRREMTLPEIILWQWMRGRPGGLRCRHQHPIGPYSLDFYCPSAKLAIEVDGEVHNRGDQPQRDAERDAWVAGQGIRTLRIAAIDVMNDLDAVTRLIVAECGILPLHQPSAGPPPHAAHGAD
jgi:very-short-patch-repair endonuclease